MLNPADQTFAKSLPDHLLRPVTDAYLDDPRGRYRGQAGIVAAPRTVEDAALIIRACHQARVPVVPRGGGTGLVGGQIRSDGPAPLVLSLERMTKIRTILADENVIITESGVTLQALRDAAFGVGRMFPLSLASQGSAQMGGILGTNAGGVNVLRYGNARALTLGVEAVMPNGDILRDLKRLRKDNTGYDLRDLLIGSEGTLGIITAASLQLVTPPATRIVALLQVPDPQAALDLLSLAQSRLSGAISAFELISGQGLRFLQATMPDLRQPFDPIPDWMVLIDIGLPQGLDQEAMSDSLLSAASEAGLISDGIVAQSQAQIDEIWRLREDLPEGNRRIGSISSHDISLPLSEIPRFIQDGGAMIAAMGDFRINCFGHLGDGNLHYNVFPAQGQNRESYDHLRADIQHKVHAMVMDRGGSFSAEHGIGRLKIGDLERWGDPVRLASMRAIKAALDPHGIMNPGVILAAPA